MGTRKTFLLLNIRTRKRYYPLSLGQRIIDSSVPLRSEMDSTSLPKAEHDGIQPVFSARRSAC